MKTKRIILISAAAIFISFLAGFVTFLNDSGYILPGYIDWQERFLSSEGFDIMLKNKHINVYKDAELVWESEKSVKVQDVLITDVDRDGVSEMTVLCWKKGRYGKYKPVTADKEGAADDTKFYSEHIFLYNLADNGPEPKWMASDIGPVVLSVETPNGYILTTHEKDGTVSEWMWANWGFTKVK